MTQLVIRKLNPDIKEKLKKRSARHGISMEAEARLILANALKEDKPSMSGLGSRIARRFSGKGMDEALPELHGEKPAPLDL